MYQDGKFKRSAWLAVFITALVVRIGAAVYWQDRLPDSSPYAFGDSHSYWTLGLLIHQGEPYRYGGDDAQMVRTPGYPIIIAGLHRLAGGHPTVLYGRILNGILGVVTIGIVALIASRLFSSTVGWVSAAILAIYPGAVSMSIMILSEAPFCLFMALQFYCLLRAYRGAAISRSMWATGSGILAAGATLIRPSWLLFTPFLLAMLLMFSSQRKRHFSVGMMTIMGLIMGMLPWWIRNYQVSDEFVPTTSRMGASLYDGLSPKATGGSDMSFITGFYAKLNTEVAEGSFSGNYELELDRRMKSAALNWAVENPAATASLAINKLGRMWNPLPNDNRLNSGKLKWLLAIGYFVVVCAAILGIWRIRKDGWERLILVTPAIYFSLLHMVFVSSIRYRQPAMILLVVLAASYLADCCFSKSRTTDLVAQGVLDA